MADDLLFCITTNSPNPFSFLSSFISYLFSILNTPVHCIQVILCLWRQMTTISPETFMKPGAHKILGDSFLLKVQISKTGETQLTWRRCVKLLKMYWRHSGTTFWEWRKPTHCLYLTLANYVCMWEKMMMGTALKMGLSFGPRPLSWDTQVMFLVSVLGLASPRSHLGSERVDERSLSVTLDTILTSK